VHDVLLRHGFDEYVEALKHHGAERLFPEWDVARAG